jgi:SagB-type dehydrogenase family enzyme
MFQQSRSLIFTLVEDIFLGHNFLQKKTFECSHEIFEILSEMRAGGEQSEDSPEMLNSLVDLGILVDKHSDCARMDRKYAEKWKWGLPAALFHFSVQGNECLDSEATEAKQIAAAETSPSPPLFTMNQEYAQQTDLPKVNFDSGLLSLMARRRTVRSFTERAVSLSEISEILFAGMGITGSVRNCVCDLPMSMTPSGGARNPYEAYVFARNIEGLESGIYHYSAAEHSLGRLSPLPEEPMGALAGNQDWIDDSSCLVVLCAHFERTMWKYDDPNAYRVVLIEAGHIGQNMMLAGTSHGLTVCATAALTHNKLYDVLDISDRIMIAPIYAFAIGEPNV